MLEMMKNFQQIGKLNKKHSEHKFLSKKWMFGTNDR